MAKKKAELATIEQPGALLSPEMLQAAKAGVATFASGAARISFKAGRISIDGQPVADNKLQVIVIGTVLAKAYYDKPYEDGVPASPVCYAFHPNDPKALAPHAAAPQKQAATCVGCPLNVFNTAQIGKGKACRDEVRVMVVTPSDDLGGAEARSLTITGNSIKSWNEYNQKLNMLGGLSPRVVITEISTEPFKATFRQTFRHAGTVTPEQFAKLDTRLAAAMEALQQPYPAIEAPEPTPKPRARKEKF